MADPDGCRDADGDDGIRLARRLVAAAIRAELEREREAVRYGSSFADRPLGGEPPANGGRIEDPSANAAWHFADSYFSYAEHGYPDCDGLPIGEARSLLTDVADRLGRGEPVHDQRVLKYEWRRGRGWTPLRALARLARAAVRIGRG